MSNIAFSVLAFLVGVFGGLCIAALAISSDKRKVTGTYDYEECWSMFEVQEALTKLNSLRYRLVCVTPSGAGGFYLYFWRPADG